jgi:hypothetical protein
VRTVVAVLVLALVAGTACGDDDADPPEPPGTTAPERDDAAVYAAVVSWFADQEPPTEDDKARDTYLDSLDEGTIPIDVQVSMVQDLEDDDLTVRFIDATEEAIDEGVDGAPVRNDGLLLRLGPVVVREEHLEVDVERYEGTDAATRYRVVVAATAQSWRVVGEPEEIPVPEPAA